MEPIDIVIARINDCISNCKATHLGLMGGQTGLILFSSFAERSGLKTLRKKSAIENLSDIINQSIPFHTFSGGYAGLLYCIDKMDQITFDKESIKAIQLYTENSGKNEIKSNHYDYLHGYLGVALGLLNIRPAFAKECIKQLNATKKYRSDGMIFWTSKKKGGEMLGDYGLAHGAASIVVILTKFINMGIELETCNNLVTEILDSLIKSKKKAQNSLFGYSMDNDNASRLAWCYGDIGIARAIWLAGKACERNDWLEEAVMIMQHASKRKDLKENMVFDAGFCHGTAGIAHIFNRFYRDTNLTEFKEVTEYWIEQTILMARFQDGLAGYKAWYGSDKGWSSEYGLLEGIAGIGLVLLSYLHPEIEPTWDSCLLLS